MKHTFNFIDGIPVEDGDPRVEVVMHEPTSGDIFASRQAAEVIKGEHIVESQALYEKEIAYRMIDSIGGAPVTPADMDRLTVADYHVLLEQLENVYGAAVKRVAKEARDRKGESES